MRQKLTIQILYDGFPKILGGLLYACLHLPLGADEVEWILVMAARHCNIQWWRYHKVDTMWVSLIRWWWLQSCSCSLPIVVAVFLCNFTDILLALCCSIIHMLLVVHLDPLRLSTLLIQPLKSYMENGIIVRYHSSVSRWHKMHTSALIFPWLEDVFRGHKSLHLCLLHCYFLGLLSIATVVCGRLLMGFPIFVCLELCSHCEW
jgi:hypothetical protein